MSTKSIWIALRKPVFRGFWLTSVVSGCFVSAHALAATWIMNALTPSPLLLSLLSTAASLPFFLLTFPAGALADMIDRKTLLCAMNLWLAVVAGGLAILGWLHLLNPWVMLVAVFLLGVGFACNAPAWTSIIPEIVDKEELASAVTLGGVQMNLSGIIGPAIGAILLPLIGTNALFALNSAGFLIIMIAIKRWHPEATQSKIPLKSFLGSLAGAVRYMHYTRGIQVLLVRALLFALLISAIPALLPVVGLKALHLSSSSLGLLFTSIAVGSLVGAVLVIPLARERYRPNTVTILASLLLAIVYCLMAYVRHLEPFMVVAALGGLSWTLAASELWVAAQQAMPDWTRGRINAAQIMISQGGLALGGIVWGAATNFVGLEFTLLIAALLVCLHLGIAIPLSIDFTRSLNLEHGPPRGMPVLIETPELHDGPIAVVADIVIERQNPKNLAQFIELMLELRLAYLRNGASSARLYKNLGEPSVFRMEAVAPTWQEYLLLHTRLTKTEHEILDRVFSLSAGPRPKVYYYLLINPRDAEGLQGL